MKWLSAGARQDLRRVVDSTVGDVVQLVRTLPSRWLESYTVTANSLPRFKKISRTRVYKGCLSTSTKCAFSIQVDLRPEPLQTSRLSGTYPSRFSHVAVKRRPLGPRALA